MIDWGDYANFSEHEFRCRGTDCCGGLAAMSPQFLGKLQKIRGIYRRPINVTSGYRCPDYNDRVSSTGRRGPHTTGRAVDIAVAGEEAFELLCVALAEKMSGLGQRQHGRWAKRFMHLDDLGRQNHPRPRLWTYP